MEEERVEERSVEVLHIPPALEDDLLWLYFENRRRSGGGNLISLNRIGDKAVLVFENADAVARVVEKGSHILSNATLMVRKKPLKDDGKFVLRGISLTTNRDMLELYVQNLTGIHSDQYTLYLSPLKDLVLVHLHTPGAEDIDGMQSRVLKRTLDGARVTLERVERTDTIVVENLPFDLSDDLLTLYFESVRSGGGDVTGVSRITPRLAKVSFRDAQSVDSVLQRPHRLEETDLTVKPYYSFLHLEGGVSPPTVPNGTPQSQDDQMGVVSPSNADLFGAGSSSPSSSSSSSTQQAATQNPDLPVEPPVSHSSQVPEAPPEHQVSVCHVSIPDPSKLELVSLSGLPEQLKRSHPDYEVTVRQDGVQVSGPSRDGAEKLKSALLEFLSGVSQVHVPVSSALKAEFLLRQDVRSELTDLLKLQGLPCTYTVTGAGVLILNSASVPMVKRARDVLTAEVSESVLNVQPEYEHMIYSEEWRAFLLTLDKCVARASPEGNSVSVVTLKDLEQEVKQNLSRFLSTPIQKEIVISMQPAMLTYIQLHHQPLLMDMAEVVILPLDTGDGMSIQGNPTACQTAAEVLSSVVSSTYTKIITVNQPGIARFLTHDPEGRSILGEMTAKFQVYINLERVQWEPLEEQDIFALVWKTMSSESFVRDSGCDGLSDLSENDKNFSARLEEAKKILLESDRSRVGAAEEKDTAEEDMDLYTDPLSSGGQLESLELYEAGDQQEDLMSLDEDASLSLAIQMSMESRHDADHLVEEELKKVLRLSREEAASVDESLMLVKAMHESLQESISSSNTAQIEVFACYTHDLVRVDIALGKKVSLRQCEEKVQHKSFRKLSSFHRRCLDLIRRKHGVEIQIQGTTAIVSGFKDYVSGAIPDLDALQERAAAAASDAEILKTVQWAWHERERAATPYPPDANVFIENAWRMKQDKLDILFNNQPYTIDFLKMQEFSVSSGRSRTVSRTLINSLDLYTQFQENDSLLADVPDAVRLAEDSEEYKEVTAEFLDSLSNRNQVHIVHVEKLMNRLLYSQYRLKKADMEQKVRGGVERKLYHGTSESSVKEICIHGFNRSFCGKNATAFGQGVYFAVESSYSFTDTYSPPNADGHKFIFVARVLTGDFTQGKHDMRAAPLRQGSDIPVRFHSVVDSMKKPTVFVIFNDTQAFPQYLITCRKGSG